MNIKQMTPVYFGTHGKDMFIYTLKTNKGNTSPEALLEKQKAILGFLEDNMERVADTIEQDTTLIREGNNAIMLLTIYERLLATLTGQRPKSDPLDTLERLEKLMKNELMSASREGEKA